MTYWQDRMEKILVDSEDLELEFERTLTLLYKEAINNIKDELQLFYAKYDKVNLLEVNKHLTFDDLKQLKENIQIYIDKLQQYDSQGSDDFIKELDIMAKRAYVSRLQALILEMEFEIVNLFADQENRLTKTYLQGYETAYYNTLYTLQTGLGVGVSFTKPTSRTVKAVLKENFLEEDFSDRIWKKRKYLVALLKQELMKGFVQGKSSLQVAEVISKKMDASLYNAKVLSRTEMNNISNQATLSAYESQEVKKYQILATLDFKTSEICREMDSKIFLCSEAKRGINYPPFHPCCRTTTVPYIADMQNKQRLAKGETGYYKVDNMSYKQWLKSYGK